MLTESPLYGVPVDAISKACEVHPDTARRWKREGNAPAGALALIRMLWEYQLGPVSAPWEGWCLRRGDLISPQGDRFTPGMVLAGHYHRARAQELERTRSHAPSGDDRRLQDTGAEIHRLLAQLGALVPRSVSKATP